MGFWFGRKDRKKLSTSLVSHLDKVDAAYMNAYTIKSMRGIQPYLTPECANKIARKVYSAKNVYFGAPKFRRTEWTLIRDENNQKHILKDVRFDKIKLGARLSLNVANDYQETWIVQKIQSKYVVLDIIGAFL